MGGGVLIGREDVLLTGSVAPAWLPVVKKEGSAGTEGPLCKSCFFV